MKTAPSRRSWWLQLVLAVAAALMIVADAAWRFSHSTTILLNDARPLAAVELAFAIGLVVWAATRARMSIGVITVSSAVLAVGVAGTASRLRQVYAPHNRYLSFEYGAESFLRRVSSAQEDYRLREGRYANALDSLGVAVPEGVSPLLRVRDTTAFYVRATAEDGRSCVLWSGRAARAVGVGLADGEPACVGSAPSTPMPLDSLLMQAEPSGHGSPAPMRLAEWPQYRRDERRTGSISERADGAAWVARIRGEIRSTPTVVGDVVLFGAHGNGELAAFVAGTGRRLWRTRVPNWIHNDVVVSRGIAYVGFGDSKPIRDTHTVFGGEPSGVAAIDALTGRMRWVANAVGNVMTSPIVTDSGVYAVTGSGRLYRFELSTGAVRWVRDLDGHVAMASPLFANEKIVVAEETASIEAFRPSDGQLLWRTRLPIGYALAGHASLSSGGGQVYGSAVERASVAGHMRHGRFNDALRLLSSYVQGGVGNLSNGDHVVFALDEATGRIAWVAPIGGGFPSYGHTAGTPVVDGSHLIVASPIAQRVVSLQAATGRQNWTHLLPAPTRGPVTILGDSVVVADRGGYVSVLSKQTGALKCRAKFSDGFDRAGPAIAGGTAFMGSLGGEVMAVPVDALLSCRIPSVPQRATVRGRAP